MLSSFCLLSTNLDLLKLPSLFLLVELDTEHAQRAHGAEQGGVPPPQVKLKERQKFFEEAFQQDMEQYLSTGYLQITERRGESAEVRYIFTCHTHALRLYLTSLKFSISHRMSKMENKNVEFEVLALFGGCNSVSGECKASTFIWINSTINIPSVETFTLQLYITRVSHNSFLQQDSTIGVALAKHTSKAITLGKKMPLHHINVVFHWDCDGILLQFPLCITAKSLF